MNLQMGRQNRIFATRIKKTMPNAAWLNQIQLARKIKGERKYVISVKYVASLPVRDFYEWLLCPKTNQSNKYGSRYNSNHRAQYLFLIAFFQFCPNAFKKAAFSGFFRAMIQALTRGPHMPRERFRNSFFAHCNRPHQIESP